MVNDSKRNGPPAKGFKKRPRNTWKSPKASKKYLKVTKNDQENQQTPEQRAPRTPELPCVPLEITTSPVFEVALQMAMSMVYLPRMRRMRRVEPPVCLVGFYVPKKPCHVWKPPNTRAQSSKKLGWLWTCFLGASGDSYGFFVVVKYPAALSHICWVACVELWLALVWSWLLVRISCCLGYLHPPFAFLHWTTLHPKKHPQNTQNTDTPQKPLQTHQKLKTPTNIITQKTENKKLPPTFPTYPSYCCRTSQARPPQRATSPLRPPRLWPPPGTSSGPGRGGEAPPPRLV